MASSIPAAVFGLLAGLSSPGLLASAMQLPGLHQVAEDATLPSEVVGAYPEKTVKAHHFARGEAMLEVSAEGLARTLSAGEMSVYDDLSMLQVQQKRQKQPVSSPEGPRPGEAVHIHGPQFLISASVRQPQPDLPTSTYEATWRATGCTDTALFVGNDLAYWRALAPDQVFADMQSWCTDDDLDHRVWCCGSHDCVPEACELQTAWALEASEAASSGTSTEPSTEPSTGPGGIPLAALPPTFTEPSLELAESAATLVVTGPKASSLKSKAAALFAPGSSLLAPKSREVHAYFERRREQKLTQQTAAEPSLELAESAATLVVTAPEVEVATVHAPAGSGRGWDVENWMPAWGTA